jgi:hypothetical protein
MGYLEALQVTHVIALIAPFHGGGRQELLRQPKAYGFDTGFVTYSRGWDHLRAEDCGKLWEHVVLETLIARHGLDRIHFWRDKQRREVDFVIPGPRRRCDAIECKWHADAFSPRGLTAFRRLHPEGANYVVTPEPGRPYLRRIADLVIVFCNLADLESGDAERLLRGADDA